MIYDYPNTIPTNKNIFTSNNLPHKSKNYYIRGGEMAEWSNAAVLKTVVLLPWDRGFESLFLRQTKKIHQKVDFLFCKGRAKLA